MPICQPCGIRVHLLLWRRRFVPMLIFLHLPIKGRCSLEPRTSEEDAIRALLGLQHLFLTWDRFAHHLHRCIHFPHSDLWTCRKLRPTSRIDGLSIALAHDWRFVLHAKYRSRPKNEGAARFEVDNLCSSRPQIMINIFWCCLPAAARYPGSCWRIVLALCWDCRSHKQHSKSKRTA